jgi:2-polyprenyl-6-methoxyphenol hydroxylase-like FAD-dependent oxidoreductase
MNTKETQVVVIGAGPVGLFAGLCAARRGLDVCVLDQNWRGYAPGHAALLHSSSLRLLSEIGVAKPLLEAGRSLRRIVFHVAGFSDLALELAEPVLAVPQRVLEESLLNELRAQGVELLAPFQATTIEQSGDRVHVRVLRRELVTLGSPAHYSEWEPVEASLVNADFLVGADGYESRVRSALGLELLTMGATESFAMFELPADGGVDSALHLDLSGDHASAMIPLPGGRVRWGFQVDSGLDEIPDAGRLRQLLGERAPWYGGQVDSIDWGTVTHFERRLARPFGNKLCWLAGDAAHVTNPFGGQSMNGGLSEAHGLVERIANSIEGKATQDALGRYDVQRQREWHKLFGRNVRIDLLAGAPSWMGAAVRRLVPMLPASGADLEKVLLQLGVRMQ